jgi:NAD(P)-dependent dehydrogenase (short-subunit alcohol dehydrogenase family)
VPDTSSSTESFVVGQRLVGKAALVTGAAGGIGRSIAHRLAAEGCNLLLTDIDAARLDEVTTSLASEGFRVAAVAADLAKAGERDRLIPEALDRWGQIDILVNNATQPGPRTLFLDLPEEEWSLIFAVNVTATAVLCRAAARSMRDAGRGSIVNITSIQVDMPVRTYAAYVASKGAVLGLTRALAVELSPAGIRVNAIAPGVIATDTFEIALKIGDAARGAQATPASSHPPATLLGRSGHADEIASAVAFLSSSDASFITGALLRVDGGRSISRRADPFEAAFGEHFAGGAS